MSCPCLSSVINVTSLSATQTRVAIPHSCNSATGLCITKPHHHHSNLSRKRRPQQKTHSLHCGFRARLSSVKFFSMRGHEWSVITAFQKNASEVGSNTDRSFLRAQYHACASEGRRTEGILSLKKWKTGLKNSETKARARPLRTSGEGSQCGERI